MRSTVIAATLAVIAGACSSDPAPSLLDAATAACLVPASYGALGTKIGTQDSTGAGVPSITVVLDPGPPKDVFYLKLVAGVGAFATTAPAPGSFTIQGVDKTPSGCGLCTSIIADIDPVRGPTKFYAADAGTVVLTSTSPVAGSASNLHLVEVDLTTSQPVASGCATTVASIAFGS